ncbi:hypothetical protein SO802_032606 [Lithocarpus litseifolius]|uniref:Uncharacterized protein n=1 Tax=Lithocarpus litseifolius TaxID=425828 RepID=A0AAW2BCQ7_9ROSI
MVLETDLVGEPGGAWKKFIRIRVDVPLDKPLRPEEMLRGLTKTSWERIDVNFSGTKQRYLAHSTIQVKRYRINSAGADVVHHMIDNFLL